MNEQYDDVIAQDWDFIVLGGGLTGLYTAQRLLEKKRSVLLVSRDIGGLLSQFAVGEYTFDFGGHVYPLDAPFLSSSAVTHTRKALFVHKDGTHVPYPVQDYPEMIGSEIKPYNIPEAGADFERLCINIFGPKFYNDFMYPFNRRVWSTQPSHMDAEWIKERVKVTDKKDKNWGFNAKFKYDLGPNIYGPMMDEIRKSEYGMLYIAHIDDIIPKRKTVISGGRELRWRYGLVSTIPFFEPRMTSLRRNLVVSVGVGLNTKITHDFSWVYNRLGQPIHRTTLLSRYHPELAPEGKDSLLLEIPLSYHDWLLQEKSILGKFDSPLSTSAMLASAGIFGIKPSDIAEVGHTVNLGYPVQTIGIRDRRLYLKRKLDLFNIYLAGRWGAHGYYNLQHIKKDVDVMFDHMIGHHDENGEYFTSEWYYGGAK